MPSVSPLSLFMSYSFSISILSAFIINILFRFWPPSDCSMSPDGPPFYLNFSWRLCFSETFITSSSNSVTNLSKYFSCTLRLSLRKSTSASRSDVSLPSDSFMRASSSLSACLLALSFRTSSYLRMISFYILNSFLYFRFSNVKTLISALKSFFHISISGIVGSVFINFFICFSSSTCTLNFKMEV